MIDQEKLKEMTGKEATIVWQSQPLKLLGGKSNPQQGRVTKITCARVKLGQAGEYDRQKVQEGEYQTVAEVKERKWGTRLGESCLIEHKGNYYLEVFILGDKVSTYYLDDQEIDYDDIQGMNPKESDSAVQYRDIRLSGIASVVSDNLVMIR